MGTEICNNCNNNDKINNEKNLSIQNLTRIDDDFHQIKSVIKPHNSLDKFESNISTKINNNENDKNNSSFDNPLYNTSLNESMNFGNCYIGTNKNNTQIKVYNPENFSKTLNNKKRFTIDPKNNTFNKSFFDKAMNKTSKNFYKNNIRYNLFFNNDIGKNENKEQEKDVFYNNSNKKNNSSYNNMSFFYNKNKIFQNDNNKSFENNNNYLIKNVNKKNKLEQKILETKEEENELKLKNIYIKYNIRLIQKITNIINKNKNKTDIKIIKDNTNKININNNNSEPEIFINNEELESFDELKDSNENEINLFPDKNYIFIGFKKNNLKNGYGLEIFKKFNSYFFGQFINNKRCGYCKYIINNKSQNYKYEGEALGLYAQGYGLYTNDETTTIYEGEWDKSLKHGFGTEHFKNNYYEGNFKNGKRCGLGVYYWEKDVFYEGEWDNNCMNGTGMYQFSKESIYEGGFKNNKMDGFGILNVKNNKIYIGFFKKDFKDGFGINIWDEEKKAYVGFWKNNKQEGFGKFFKNNRVKYGLYQKGKIVNEVKDNENVNKIYNEINKYLSLFFELRNYDEVKNKVFEYINMK